MNYVGVNLHKKTIVLCVMNQDRKVTHRRTFACGDVEAISLSSANWARSRWPSRPPPATNGSSP